ncbi:interleukin-9 receptor [Tupaia chinensis]|uniref:interleukin-9 receptor n=1 Tax=Tupaia chinensis TaxID=246437 RepID=UPI0003C8D286|nr:interleukin-9 receptor [Tupaia chinensis]
MPASSLGHGEAPGGEPLGALCWEALGRAALPEVPSPDPQPSLAGWTLESEALMRDLGSWLLLCTCMCSRACLGASVPGAGGGPSAGPFTCLTNNILRIHCRWSTPELGQGSSPWLLFTSNQEPGSRHACVFRGSECSVELPPEEVLVPSDNFTITFHHCLSGKEQVSLVDSQYLPRRHVKLDPPSGLQSNISSSHCALTWTVEAALEPMVSLLSYELAFKKQGEAWEQARHKGRIVGLTRIILEAVELDPDSTYEARLRVRMATLEEDAVEERYDGQWSEWSQPVSFLSPQRQGPPTPSWGRPDSTLIAMSLFLLLSGLIYLLFKLTPRVKRSFYQNVPSPAAFFQPLYSVHRGDFQVWTGAHRAGLQQSQDQIGTPQGTLETGVWEAIALLTFGPALPWPPLGPEEGKITSFPGAPSSEEVLPAGRVPPRGQLSVYLPQEDWAPAPRPRPAPPGSEGGSGDYCVVGCYGVGSPTALPGNTQSPGPVPAVACVLHCDQQDLEPQHGGTCVGSGHSLRQDPVQQVA